MYAGHYKRRQRSGYLRTGAEHWHHLQFSCRVNSFQLKRAGKTFPLSFIKIKLTHNQYLHEPNTPNFQLFATTFDASEDRMFHSVFQKTGFMTVSALIRPAFEASTILSTKVEIVRPISPMRLRKNKFLLFKESTLELHPAPPGNEFFKFCEAVEIAAEKNAAILAFKKPKLTSSNV